MMDPVPLTCIILTFNEQKNIGDSLQTLGWIDEVLLLDSNSTDRTIEVAKEVRPDIHVYSNKFIDFGQQRNWALDNCTPKHPWILFLDADEHSNNEFRQQIEQTIADPQDYVGFYLTYRNMFLGKWLKHSTFYPSWQLRLLKHGQVRYKKEGHGQREVTEGKLGYLNSPYDHYPFQNGLENWLAKHNRYSSTECELVEKLKSETLDLQELFSTSPLVRRRAAKRLASRIGCKPISRFIYTYILRGGFMDGLPGYIYCRLMAQYEFQLWAKLVEKSRTEQRPLD